MRIVKRLQSAWSRNSVGGFLGLALKNISYYLAALFSGRLFRLASNNVSEFDAVYGGTDTEKIREIGSLSIDSENARHAVRYQPSPQDLATEIISALPIDHSQFVFLDFGAGKGRVLLIAAQLPFASVIGIEFSKELCAVAMDNIDKIRGGRPNAGPIACYCEDVTQFPLPEVPLVCYFYNPFDHIIMRVVVDRLLASLKTKPREIYIVYVHPEHRVLFDEKDDWNIVQEGKFHVVYQACLNWL